MRELSAEAEALWRAVEVANASDSGGARVLTMLDQLARVAPEGTEAWAYAHRERAALLLSESPWRAAVSARRALEYLASDAMAWGILGLTQVMLGNHPYAVRAYRKALQYEPDNPWYAHNLGHLLDVHFDRPAEAVPLLERAVKHLWEWPEATRRHRVEIMASLAQAQMRSGRLGAAHTHIRSVVKSGLASHAHHELHRLVREALEASLTEELRRLDHTVPRRRRVRKRRETSVASGSTD